MKLPAHIGGPRPPMERGRSAPAAGRALPFGAVLLFFSNFSNDPATCVFSVLSVFLWTCQLTNTGGRKEMKKRNSGMDCWNADDDEQMQEMLGVFHAKLKHASRVGRETQRKPHHHTDDSQTASVRHDRPRRPRRGGSFLQNGGR